MLVNGVVFLARVFSKVKEHSSSSCGRTNISRSSSSTSSFSSTTAETEALEAFDFETVGEALVPGVSGSLT